MASLPVQIYVNSTWEGFPRAPEAKFGREKVMALGIIIINALFLAADSKLLGLPGA